MKKILIASGNQGKIREFKQMLEPMGYEVLSLKDLENPVEPEETGTTFAENAIIKAQSVCEKVDMTVIADDSGLEIDAFNKEPGVNSARYLGHDTPYDYKNSVILQRMEGITNRTARYVCAVAYCAPNEEPHVFVGTLEGEIGHEQRGNNGFGYDPIFYLPELGKTTGELLPEEKNAISHRGIALRQFLTFLQDLNHETN